MAKNVKRARGSNQYSEKYDFVSAEERRLPRKRRNGMSRSGKMMATPGKPFQCPSCGDLHPTGVACKKCQPVTPSSAFTCAGCGTAIAPSGAILCERCEELASVSISVPAPAPIIPSPSMTPAAVSAGDYSNASYQQQQQQWRQQQNFSSPGYPPVSPSGVPRGQSAPQTPQGTQGTQVTQGTQARKGGLPPRKLPPRG